MKEHGLVFVSLDRFKGPDALAKEFDKGLEMFPQKPKTCVLCAHSGRSYEVAKAISNRMHTDLLPSSFLESNRDPETALIFVEKFSASCNDGELVFVVVNRNQLNYVRKHIREMAGYMVGNLYAVR